MNLLMRLFLFVVLLVALWSQQTLGNEFNVDADSVQNNNHERPFSSAGGSDHVVLKAASYGETRTVLDILRHDPDLLHHVNDMGWSSLMFATANGHTELMRALLEAGADPNQQENDGWSPIMFASFHGDSPAVDLLIEFHANLLLRNHRGYSAHELARTQHHDFMADVLGRLTVFAAMSERNFPEMLAHLEQGISPNVQNPAGWTPLITAIDANDAGAFDRLLDMGADVNVVERDHWSPLMFAAFRGDGNMVRRLLRQGARVDAHALDNAEVNALYWAVQHQHVECARILIEEGYEAQGVSLPAWYNPNQQQHHHHEEEVERNEHDEEEEERHRDAELRHKRELLAEEERREQEEAQLLKNKNNNHKNKKRGGTGFFNW